MYIFSYNIYGLFAMDRIIYRRIDTYIANYAVAATWGLWMVSASSFGLVLGLTSGCIATKAKYWGHLRDSYSRSADNPGTVQRSSRGLMKKTFVSICCM